MTSSEMKRLRELTQRRSLIEERLQSLSDASQTLTATLDGMPRSSTVRSAVEELVVRLEESRVEYEAILSEFYRLRRRLLDLTGALTLQEREVIHRRYLECENFKAVSTGMCLSISRVFQIHRRALRRVLSADECSVQHLDKA